VGYIPFDFNDPQQALTTLLAHLQGAKLAMERGLGALLVIGAIIVGALVLGGEG
jgi:hypothetical protein